jgi:hypothetical protein
MDKTMSDTADHQKINIDIALEFSRDRLGNDKTATTQECIDKRQETYYTQQSQLLSNQRVRTNQTSTTSNQLLGQHIKYDRASGEDGLSQKYTEERRSMMCNTPNIGCDSQKLDTPGAYYSSC